MPEINSNPLYPVFFKLDKLKMLIVGGGEVGYEKLNFILKSSPNANIEIVAPWVGEEVKGLIESGKYNLDWHAKEFAAEDIDGHDLIVAATNITAVNHAVHKEAKYKNKLINVADTPDLCDFYLGAIVTRGDLKVAISTNGKSPTFAKRFRQLLEEMLPDNTDEILQNLKVIRDQLVGDFDYKVQELNRITKSLLEKTTV